MNQEEYEELHWEEKNKLDKEQFRHIQNVGSGFVRLKEGFTHWAAHQGKSYKMYQVYSQYEEFTLLPYITSGNNSPVCVSEDLFAFEPVPPEELGILVDLQKIIDDAQKELDARKQDLYDSGIVMAIGENSEPDWNSSSLYC